MSATHDSSERAPAPETDETQDRESPDMETDDLDLSHLLLRSLALRHRCFNTEFMVNVKLQWYTEEMSDLALSCLKRMSCSCPVNCRGFESKFRNMSAITELKELEPTLSL